MSSISDTTRAHCMRVHCSMHAVRFPGRFDQQTGALSCKQPEMLLVVLWSRGSLKSLRRGLLSNCPRSRAPSA